MLPPSLAAVELRSLSIPAALLTFALVLAGSAAHAADGLPVPPPDLKKLGQQISDRYPTGSIRDEETADRARADATTTRNQVDWAAYDREVECQKRFFVTSCIEEVHRDQRTASWAARDIELEANAFVRRKRDEEYLAKRARDMADADAQTQRMAEQHAQDQADYKRAQQGGAVAPLVPVKPRTSEPALPTRQLTPEERAANQKAYEQKQQDALDHQKAIAEKQSKRTQTNPPAAPTQP